MNSKQRLLAALDGQEPDIVPVAPCYPNLYLRQFQWQAYVEAYHARMQGQAGYQLSPDEDNEIWYQSRTKALDAWIEQPDWVGISPGPSIETQAHSTLYLRGEDLLLVDERDGEAVNLTNLAHGESNELLRRRIEDLSVDKTLTEHQVDEQVPVDSPEDLLQSGRYQVAQRMIEKCGDQSFTHSVLSTPYPTVQYVTGFYNMMVLMKESPALIQCVLERKLQVALAQLEVWAELGVHGVWLQEVFSGADTISPDAYDEFVYPTTRQTVRRCQDLGMKAIYYPCGDILPRLARVVEMAPDALAFEESKKTFVLDVADVRSQVGDELCLFGNLDAYGDLEIASDEVLRDEVGRQIREGSVEGKRFVMSIGSPITPDTPPERVGAFICMSRELGRYPLHS